VLIPLRGWLCAIAYTIAACLGTIFVSGCAVDPEERAFFYRGWQHPQTDAEEERNLREEGAHSATDPHYKKDPLTDE